ncbi:MAG: nucleotidyl transferase AbiEii/AbiGii toxin family protein [Candidatus Coatesbacteria bacterium]
MGTILDLREHFHLAFLRHLSQRLRGRRWAVKGGICLRFFHRSPRMSEDIDLDVEPRVSLDALRNAVGPFIEGRLSASVLASGGVTGLASSAPKQTRTVQRWKVSLERGGDAPLTTKVEFSRRRAEIPFTSGTPAAAILERHGFAPFVAHFYDPREMAAQKIAAMASPTRHACRDLFDLDHIFDSLRIDIPGLKPVVPPAEVRTAADKLDGFSYASFREEVVPFLDGDLMELYDNRRAFDDLKERVAAALARLTD